MSAPGGEALGGIRCYRFEGYDLATKYGWMQTGQGAGAVGPGHDYLTKMAQAYQQSDQNLRSQLAKLGVTWTGQAAEGASQGLTQLADYAQSAQQTSTAGTSSLQSYGQSFADTKPKIPKPVEVGQNSFWGNALDSALGSAAGVFDIQSDYRRRLQQYQQQDAQANQALYAHQKLAQDTVDQFQLGAQAPKVVAGGAAGAPGAAGSPGGGAGTGAAADGAGAG